MALDIIRRDGSEMPADVTLRLSEAQPRLAQGGDRERVEAAGELSVLSNQGGVATERLAEIDAAPADASEALLRWLKEEVFNLKPQVDPWIAKA